MRTDFSQTQANTRDFPSEQFSMWDHQSDEVEMTPGFPSDFELKFTDPEKHDFDLVSAVVHSEMSKMTQDEKRRACANYRLPEDPRCWTVDQVVTWIGVMVKNCSIVDNFTATIKRCEINGARLCSMTEAEFKATFPNDDVIFQCLKYWKEVPISGYTDLMTPEQQYSFACDGESDMKEIIRRAMEDPSGDDDMPSPAESGYSSDYYHNTDCHMTSATPYMSRMGLGEAVCDMKMMSPYGMHDYWQRAPNPMIGGGNTNITPPNTPVAMDSSDYSYGCQTPVSYIKTEPGLGYCNSARMSCTHAPDYRQNEWTHPPTNTACPPATVMKHRRKGPGRPPKPESEKKRKKVGRGQPLLWEYILQCLDNKMSGEMLTWVDRNNGIFKFFSGGKELFAKSWGSTKGNRKLMTYQKMARALRDYGKKNIIIKYKKKLHYKFISEKTLNFLKTSHHSAAPLRGHLMSPQMLSDVSMTSPHSDETP
ncbi:ETS-related transcription factor Elf-3-like [Ptychodera flava]|uniref:ETS-related transcription factor Elf-3-like n=1 Tax=Ptychodera flava TaxID=63121 RepID=UPI00396A5C6C